MTITEKSITAAISEYLYYYSDYCFTANISGIWTVENGEPVEINLPQSGQVVYRGDPYGFELWVDSYNNYYEPDEIYGQDIPGDPIFIIMIRGQGCSRPTRAKTFPPKS